MAFSSKSWLVLVVLLLVILVLPLFIYLGAPKPCQEPITYRIGRVDQRFGLDYKDLRGIVKEASDLWGEPFSRALFREDPQGTIEIRLVYDHRQAATDRLKKLNYRIDYSRNSYNELMSHLESLKSDLTQKNSSLREDIRTYEFKVNAFNSEVGAWNRQGGGTESVHRILVSEKANLVALKETLDLRREELQGLAETINSLVTVINEIAFNLNLALVDQKTTGESLGREFCEGLYEKKDGRQTITIYQFENRDRLVRVLAHEFGHALGLAHSEDQKAVMYRLNNSLSLVLDSDDLVALKKRCPGLSITP